MKAFTYSALAALLSLGLGGCEKVTGPTQATGGVVDRQTRQPVAGAWVVAVGSSGSWAGGGSRSRGTTADGQGRFALAFEAAANEQYQLGTSTASGYTNQGNGPLLSGGQRTDNLVVYADAPAWVKVNCVDDPPYGRVGLTTWGYLDGPNGISDSQNVGPGNSYFIRSALSYTSGQAVSWRLTDLQGNSKEGRIPYTTAGFDTTTVTIHF